MVKFCVIFFVVLAVFTVEVRVIAALPVDSSETLRILNTDAANDEVAELNVEESQSTDYGVESQADDGQSNGLLKIPLLHSPSKTAESVNLEHEGIPSKILSTYDKSQKKLVDITNPVPILDTISEHEKYGNNGDMFEGISRSIVNGYEAFANLLNSLITKPQQLARKITKGITAQLDAIGGKLVGL